MDADMDAAAVANLCWKADDTLHTNVPESWTTAWNAINAAKNALAKESQADVAEFAALVVDRIGSVTDSNGKPSDQGKGWVLQHLMASMTTDQDRLLTKVVLWAVPKYLVVKFIRFHKAFSVDYAQGYLRYLLTSFAATDIDLVAFQVYLLTNNDTQWSPQTRSQMDKEVKKYALVVPVVEQWRVAAEAANICNHDSFEACRPRIETITSSGTTGEGDSTAVKVLQLLRSTLDCYKAFGKVHADFALPGTAAAGGLGARPPVYEVEARTQRFAGITDKYTAAQNQFFDGTLVGEQLKNKLYAGQPGHDISCRLGEEVLMLQWRLSLDAIVSSNKHLTPIVPEEVEAHVLGPSAKLYFTTDDDKRLATFLVYSFAFGQINGWEGRGGLGSKTYKTFLQAAAILVSWKYAKKDIGSIPQTTLTAAAVDQDVEYAGIKNRFFHMMAYLQENHSWVPKIGKNSLFEHKPTTQIGSSVNGLKKNCSTGGIAGPGYVLANERLATPKKGLHVAQYMTMVTLLGSEFVEKQMDMSRGQDKTYTTHLLDREHGPKNACFLLQTTDRTTFPPAYKTSFERAPVQADVVQSKAFVDLKYGPLLNENMFRAELTAPRTGAGHPMRWSVTSPFLSPEQKPGGVKRRRTNYSPNATVQQLTFEGDD